MIDVALAGLVLSLTGVAYLSPQFHRMIQECELSRLCRRTRSLVLSYDDGPGGDLTPSILDLLACYRGTATFFPLGFRVANNAEVVDRIVAEGHEVGCHGQDHLNAWKVWPWEAVGDIERGYQSMCRWVARDGLFRPPYGKLSLPTWWAVRRRGARIGWWTIDSGDTSLCLPDPRKTVEAAVRAGGGIVLLHDFDRSTSRVGFVLRTTELLLRAAEREGWAIKQLGNLLDSETSTFDV